MSHPEHSAVLCSLHGLDAEVRFLKVYENQRAVEFLAITLEKKDKLLCLVNKAIVRHTLLIQNMLIVLISVAGLICTWNW